MTTSMLTPTDVAELLGVTVQTLANWRVKKVGPPWIKLVGAVRYDESDLRDWIASCSSDAAVRP